MDWMEWVIAGVFVAFPISLSIVVSTTIRHVNKS